MTAHQWGVTLVRLALGAIWLWAGVTKLRDPAGTHATVKEHRLVPHWAAPTVARSLPTVEAALGTGLIAGWHWRFLAWTSVALLGLLTVSLLTVVTRHESAVGTAGQAGCGCFGRREIQEAQPDRSTAGTGTAIARNFLLALAAAILASAS